MSRTSHVITVDGVTPEWLTAALRRSGELPLGHVRSVERAPNAAFNSAVTHLTVTCAPDAPPLAPTRLLFKGSLTEDWAIQAAASEVGFYELLAGRPEPLPIVPRCYDAAYDGESGTSHLLLLDLSRSHRQPLTRDQLIAGDSVPSPEHLDWVVEAMARFHAYWWQDTRLGQGVGMVSEWCRDAAHYRRLVERREREWAAFIADVGSWFPADVRVLYEHTLARLPRLWPRYLEPRVTTLTNLTLIHGDCYFSNVLVPRNAGSGTTTLIDFQDIGADVGAGDLVNLCATFWTPAQRRDGGREVRVLRRYHAGLLEHGVAGYS